jgi:hypothetical protein
MKPSRIEVLARKRGVRHLNALLVQSGGTISANAVASRLGLSRQAVVDRARSGQILALRITRHDAYRFPLFQFGLDGQSLISGIEEALRELNVEPLLDGSAKVTFFLSKRDSLGGFSPMALLQQGQLEMVIALARSYAN